MKFFIVLIDNVKKLGWNTLLPLIVKCDLGYDFLLSGLNGNMELNKWNIFSLQDSSFMAKVRTVCVFGKFNFHSETPT